jgi:hypothetical protein
MRWNGIIWDGREDKEKAYDTRVKRGVNRGRVKSIGKGPKNR